MPASRLDTTSFRALLRCAARAVNGGALPGRASPTANSFGLYLAWLWALQGERGPRSSVYVYALKRSTPRGVDLFRRLPASLREELGPRLRDDKFLSDVFVTSRSPQNTRRRTLLAAEIEALPTPDVRYYLWDFSKLLHVKASKRLFVACAAPERLDALADTLAQGYLDAGSLQGAEQTCVCLLPSTTDWSDVRLGIVADTGELRFES